MSSSPCTPQSGPGAPLQHPRPPNHLQPSQHSLHQPLGPIAAQVIGHAVGAVERGFDIEAAQVSRVGLVEVKGDTGDIDPARGLAGQAELVPRCLGWHTTRVTHLIQHPGYHPASQVPPSPASLIIESHNGLG